MRSEDVRELVEARPFNPFRIHLSDGRKFEIRHPEFVWVLRSRLVIAMPDKKKRGLIDRLEHCSLLHITSLEELDSKPH